MVFLCCNVILFYFAQDEVLLVDRCCMLGKTVGLLEIIRVQRLSKPRYPRQKEATAEAQFAKEFK